jgi:hypothetical protein
MKKEKILCAAIYCKGEVDMAGMPLIYCGHRHHNILHQHPCVSRHPHDQGFLTSQGRFVNRLNAMVIATESKQVLPKKLHNPLIGLFSEDLY